MSATFRRQVKFVFKDYNGDARLVMAVAARWYLEVRSLWGNPAITDLAPDILTPLDWDAYTRGLSALIARVGSFASRETLFLGNLYSALQDVSGSASKLGIHYTPAEVVDSILAETLNGTLDRKGLASSENALGRLPTIIDPSCGGGAFLIGAFDRLHNFISQNRLLPAERIASYVLRHKIYGADIDPLGLSVARITLATRALEHGTPDVPHLNLARLDMLSDSGMPTDWPNVFDAVVGNPPFIEGRNLSTAQISEYKKRFASARGKCNTFGFFLERGLELCRRGGRLGYIVPAPFLRNDRYWALRRAVLANKLDKVVGIEHSPFGSPVVENALVFVTRWDGAPENHQVQYAVVPSCAQLQEAGFRRVNQKIFAEPAPGKMDASADEERTSDGRINLLADPDELDLARRLLRRGMPLDALADIRDGISTGFAPFPRLLLGRREGGRFVDGRGISMPFDATLHRPVIDGNEFTALGPIHWEGRYIRYDKALEQEPPPPRGRPFNCQLREPGIFEREEKIVSRQTADRIICTVDRGRFYARNTVHNTWFKDVYSREFGLAALALLLSGELMNFIYVVESQEIGRVFPQVHIADLRLLPVVDGLLVRGGALDTLGERILRLRVSGTANPVEDEQLARMADEVIRVAYGITREEYDVIRAFAGRTRDSRKKAA